MIKILFPIVDTQIWLTCRGYEYNNVWWFIFGIVTSDKEKYTI